MNAPYDGDRGQGASDTAPLRGVPPEPPATGHVPSPQQPESVPDPYAAPDPYVQDAYSHDPYRSQDPSAQDPVTEALYDRASHPPPPPGTYQEPQPLYQQPAASPYAPDPHVWAQTPPPEPDGPSRLLPYGDDPATT
ncbi:murein biosynthesis integral membrane protein MurJ, partial [Streptomyces chryseus]